MKDRLRFANKAEVVLYDALYARQHHLPPNETIGILPGPGFRTRDATFGPDVVVTFKGRAIGVEVDGPHHERLYAADRSRDDLLKDAGLIDVYRIPVEDTADPVVLDGHIERLMTRPRG